MPDPAEGRHLYGQDPATYALGRPDYPHHVYEVLRNRCGLAPLARVVEIGPGTGLVTRHLLDAGAHVTAIEANAAMARYLADACSERDLDVLVAAFEDVELPVDSFDLAVAATSFHWVEPTRGMQQLHRTLRAGGWAAIWWIMFEDPEAPDDVSRVVERILVPPPGRDPTVRPFQLDARARCDALEETGFVDVESEIIWNTVELDPSQARLLYASMAVVLRLSGAERARVLDAIETTVKEQPGCRIARQLVTAMYTARKPWPASHDPRAVTSAVHQ